MKDRGEDRVLLRPEEAAERLGLSRATVYALIAGGEIESIHIGRSRRIPVAALAKFVDARREPVAV